MSEPRQPRRTRRPTWWTTETAMYLAGEMSWYDYWVGDEEPAWTGPSDAAVAALGPLFTHAGDCAQCDTGTCCGLGEQLVNAFVAAWPDTQTMVRTGLEAIVLHMVHSNCPMCTDLSRGFCAPAVNVLTIFGAYDKPQRRVRRRRSRGRTYRHIAIGEILDE
jgi:hypothetical protein